jgi:hypothetical protein
MSLAFPPAGFAYIQLYPIWMAALGVFLHRQAAGMEAAARNSSVPTTV